MKRILITLCAVILSFSAQAQEHMTFKGVSMGCDITTFVSQLESKGFTVDYEADNGVILTGDFAGNERTYPCDQLGHHVVLSLIECGHVAGY